MQHLLPSPLCLPFLPPPSLPPASLELLWRGPAGQHISGGHPWPACFMRRPSTTAATPSPGRGSAVVPSGDGAEVPSRQGRLRAIAARAKTRAALELKHRSAPRFGAHCAAALVSLQIDNGHHSHPPAPHCNSGHRPPVHGRRRRLPALVRGEDGTKSGGETRERRRGEQVPMWRTCPRTRRAVSTRTGATGRGELGREHDGVELLQLGRREGLGERGGKEKEREGEKIVGYDMWPDVNMQSMCHACSFTWIMEIWTSHELVNSGTPMYIFEV
ncbi:hypothetical protein SEVIR_1G193201v4 [Setaria viridis]